MAEDKALGILKGARHLEEAVIPILTKHLESAVFWAGVAADKAARAKEILRHLAKQSVEHKIAVERLIARLEGR